METSVTAPIAIPDAPGGLAPAHASTPIGTHTRLHGKLLWLARAVYVAMLVLTLGLYASGLPLIFGLISSATIGVLFRYGGAGEILLSPTNGLPAAEAGIPEGAVLLAVDGDPLHAWLSRDETTQRLTGPIGSRVELLIRAPDGTQRQVTVTRDVRGLQQLDISPRAYAFFFIAWDILLAAGFSIPALVIFIRRSDDWFAMFVSLILMVLPTATTSTWFSLRQMQPQWLIPITLILSFDGLAILLFLYLFPNGRWAPRWIWKLMPIGIVWVLLQQLPPPFEPWSWPYGLATVFDVSIYGTGLVAQVYRYRHVSSPQERLQTRWVVFGIAITFLGIFGTVIPQVMVPALQEMTPVGIRYNLVAQSVRYLATLVLPVTITISILRYRLYDIDLIINRTLVYVPLTAILAGLFAATTAVSQKLFISLTGQTSDAASVFATLIVVAAVTPIKDHIQSRVDKHFKGSPSPGKRLKAFAGQLRSRLFPVNEGEIMRTLLEEAVLAFDAACGAVYRPGEPNASPVLATRNWDSSAQLSAPISHAGHAAFGVVALGARRNGADYTTHDREELMRAAAAVALAIEQDHGVMQVARGK